METSDERNRARQLISDAPRYNDKFKTKYLLEALNLTRDIKDIYVRTHLLVDIARLINDEHKTQILQEALVVASAGRNEDTCVFVLENLAPCLNNTPHLLPEALAIALKIKDERARAEAMGTLARHLNDIPKTKMLQEAFVAAHEIKDATARSRALTNLVPHLNDELKTQALQEALVAAQKIKDAAARFHVLMDFIQPVMNDEIKAQALQEALAAALEIKDVTTRFHALMDIARHLGDDLKAQTLQGALVAAHNIKDTSARFHALTDIARHLGDDLKAQALQGALVAAHNIKDTSARFHALTDIAIHLNEELKTQTLQDALAAAYKIKDALNCVRALTYLAPYQNNKIKTQTLEDAFDVTCEIKDEYIRAHELADIFPHLNEELKAQALAAVREIKNEYIRARALSYLLPHLNDELKAQALAEIREIETTHAKYGQSKSTLRNSIDNVPDANVADLFIRVDAHDAEREESNIRADKISFTAYHPKESNIKSWHTLLVYTHIVSAWAKVQQDVLRFTDQIQSPKKNTSQSLTSITRGTELTIIPSCEGVDFNPERVSFKWLEDFHRADFRFKADESLAGDAAKGQITIYAGPLIIGTLKFAMLFNEKDTQPDLDHEEHVKMYGKDDVFISYSRKDSEVARTFKTVLEGTGLDVFLDVDDIKSGQLWEDELKRRIERAQIFQIFWSANYSQSENCKQEWEYALQQNKDEGYIRPVFWEKPISPNPPEELNKFNFKYVELPMSKAD